jgi:hypothetical protein
VINLLDKTDSPVQHHILARRNRRYMEEQKTRPKDKGNRQKAQKSEIPKEKIKTGKQTFQAFNGFL